MCRSATSELVKMYFEIQSLIIKLCSSAKEEVDECLGNVVKSLEEAENVKEVRQHIQLGGETYHNSLDFLFVNFLYCVLGVIFCPTLLVTYSCYHSEFLIFGPALQMFFSY